MVGDSNSPPLSNSQLEELKRKEKLPNITEFSAELETYRNSKCWIMGEEKFKTCCKIVAYGLDFWASAAIDIETFNRKQQPEHVLTDTAVGEVGGFLQTFYHTLWMKDIDDLLSMLKEMVAALSQQNRKEFAVSYQFLPISFRECLYSKFPKFMQLVLGEQPVEEVVSPTLRRSPRKHGSSSKSVCQPSPRPTRSKKNVFAHCEVAEDEASDSDGEVQGGGEFVGSDINNTDSNRTPLQNVLSVSLSQVDISMLTSTSTVGHQSSSLLCYADVMEHIPPLLAQSWSMKFFPVEKEVPFNQHPQQLVMKKCAIVNSSSLPQPGDPAVSCRFQCESSTVQFFLF